MIYFNEMNNKYGFADGSAIPREALECRTVYVRVLNVLLERLGSACRILPFDRGGCHNWCLWIRVSVETYNQIVSETKSGSDPDGSGLQDYQEPEPDDAWRQAVGIANQMGLDECIEVRVQIDDSALNETLEFAKTGQLPEEIDEEIDE